jgi:hypothetical protein
MLHKMICGKFNEGKSREFIIDDVHGVTFTNLLDVWCQKMCIGGKPLEDLFDLAVVADRFQMVEVGAAIEDCIVQNLALETCVDILMKSCSARLSRAEIESQKTIVAHFDEVCATKSFMRLDEEQILAIVSDDGLGVENEEAVLEAAVMWLKGRVGTEPADSGRLLRAIRFGLMDRLYLESGARKAVPPDLLGLVEPLLLEALQAMNLKETGGTYQPKQLGPKALTQRRRPGVQWDRYAGGGEARLDGHTDHITSITECRGRVFTGSLDGTIREWDVAATAPGLTLAADEGLEPVHALASWEGMVISGHRGGRVAVWDVRRGACVRVLDGRDDVSALAVAGMHLAVAAEDEGVQLWRMAAAGAWACERTLRVPGEWVSALAAWEGRAVAAFSDGAVRVWAAATGALEATLPADGGGSVTCLLAHRGRLFSASCQGRIVARAAAGWARLWAVEAYGDRRQAPGCLAVSGGGLVCGSAGRYCIGPAHCRRFEVRRPWVSVIRLAIRVPRSRGGRGGSPETRVCGPGRPRRLTLPYDPYVSIMRRRRRERGEAAARRPRCGFAGGGRGQGAIGAQE